MGVSTKDQLGEMNLINVQRQHVCRLIVMDIIRLI